MTLRNITCACTVLLALLGLPGMHMFCLAQTPVVSVRFANPQNSCVTLEYCLDVEFKANVPDQEIFGMNIRFFYDDDVLELVDFRDFQGGYGPVAPNPPIIATSDAAGPALFNFEGAAEFVNGAMQLINSNAPPILLDTGEWTKLFQICFLVDDPDANLDTFCPSVLWDLEQDPEDGGFLAGDDGVVITVDDPDPNNESLPTLENVFQFNWVYSGNGTPPFGQPVETTCSNINCTLPLALLSFKGAATESGNKLDWETISEINVSGFEVERSRNGKDWESIGFEPGSGTSQGLKLYSFLDQFPDWGTDYYRLRHVDLDGRFGYSPIIRIEDPAALINRDILIYPNPVYNGDVFIYIPQLPVEGGSIRLHDSKGLLVREMRIQDAMNRMEIDGLSPGVYVVIISTLTGNICKKVAIY